MLETLKRKFHTVKLPKSFVAVNLSEKIPEEFVKDVPDGDGEGVAADDVKKAAEGASQVASQH